LAQGHTGLAVLFHQVDACFPGAGYAAEAHRHLGLAVEALRRSPRAETGLLSGLAGLAFAAHALDPERYERLLSTLDGLIARRTKAVLATLKVRRSGCAEHEVDVVSGVTGIGVYFLTRRDEGSL